MPRILSGPLKFLILSPLLLFLAAGCEETGNMSIFSSKLSVLLDLKASEGRIENLDMKTAVDASGKVLLSKTFVYSQATFPGAAFTAGVSYTQYVPSLGLLYIVGGGVTVIDTMMTKDKTDDVLVRTYTTTSTPAISSTSVRSIRYYESSGYLYVSCYNGGLSVIDTKKNKDPLDDVLVINYSPSSTPSAGNRPYDSLLTAGGILFIADYSSGLIIIDTQGTDSPADDVRVSTYTTASMPAIPGIRGLNLHFDESNGYLWAATSGGLTVIDTQFTATMTDDVIVKIYNTLSSPATTAEWALGLFFDSVTKLVYTADYFVAASEPLGLGGGFSIIDTQGTDDPADDTTFLNYKSVNGIGSIQQYTIRLDHLNANKIYLGGLAGLFIVDHKGTSTVADDSVERWSVINHKLPGDYVFHTSYNTHLDELQVSTSQSGSAGLLAFGDLYNSSGSFYLNPQDVPDFSGEVKVKWEENTPSSTDVTVQARTLNWSYAEDFNSDFDLGKTVNPWGAGPDFVFSSRTIEDGKLVITGNMPRTSGTYTIDVGGVDDFFPAESLIVIRYRALTNNLAFTDFLHTDQREVERLKIFNTGEWQTLVLKPSQPFRYLYFIAEWFSGPAWTTVGDRIELDWIRIATPSDFSAWSSVKTDPTGSVLDDVDFSRDAIQFRVNLSTTDTTKTPSVSRVQMYQVVDP